MIAWYTTYPRFEKRILSSWKKRKFAYHAGHVNILKYAYRTLVYWSCVKGEKISEKNKIDVDNLSLF